MKLLLHSNGPQVPTGYGIQTALLADRLKRAGHDVAISAYYGQQSGSARWHDIQVYPGGFEPHGNDIVTHHALHHFGGDKRGGWIIPIMDVFGLQNPELAEFNVAAWCPVDHFPVPPQVIQFFQNTGAVPIAMSRFGEQMLRQCGLDPLYAPLTVDTDVFQPNEILEGAHIRDILDIPRDAFMITMNGMNKGWAIHRKGFPQAFLAFADFAKRHPEAVLYMHTEQLGGAGGVNLPRLAMCAGVPQHQIRWADQYAYRMNLPAPALAAIYSTSDVLLAPSMGEGFCVPLIEAQACGTPVIVTDFSAQPELISEGCWKVDGQPWWEEPQAAWMIDPNIRSIVEALDESYDADRDAMTEGCIAKAHEYNADTVFEECWLPILKELAGGDPIPLEARHTIPQIDGVAVLVPVLNRPQNVAPLIESFDAATNDDEANLYFVVDADDQDEIEAIKAAGGTYLVSKRGSSYAQKINSGFQQTTEPWIFACGDDVRFHPGWIDAARKHSERYDVIGTNDRGLDDNRGNPRVEVGEHADHFFVRRSYADRYGASLGKLVAHEGYRHFFTDVEIVELAKARRVFTPCLDSFVEHLHPDLNKSEVDDTYRKGWAEREHDAAVWKQRAPLVAQQKQGRAA